MSPPNRPETLRRPPSRGLKIAGVVAACAAVAIVATGVLSRVRADQNLKAWTNAQAIPTVALAKVSAGDGAQGLTLPGNIQAFYNAPIHARVSGYVKRWYTDIGAPVKQGQVLAEIDTPELDQQLAQAKADLATAQANQALSKTTAARWNALLAQDAVSRQEADEKSGDLAAKSSLVNAARANVQRLEATQGFRRIVAPFDGVVTARNTDIGALIGVGGTADAALFTVADVHRLRVYVQVPQSYSAAIHPGLTASLTVPEYPGRTFQATMSGTSGAVGAQSGAVLVEFQADNPNGALKAGEYAEVHLDLPSSASTVRAPASALLFRHAGPVVATVGPDSRVVLKPVTISRDLGTSVEIGSGLSHSDRLIDSPPDSLSNGDLVRIVGASAEPLGARARRGAVSNARS